jgi:hypothetical protein
MLARLAVRAMSFGGSTRPLRTGMPCVAALALLAPAAALAQLVPKTAPDLGTAGVLPPGPTVTDWQPRGRAAVGTKIVITGPAFTPSAVEATIGGGHIPSGAAGHEHRHAHRAGCAGGSLVRSGRWRSAIAALAERCSGRVPDRRLKPAIGLRLP